MYFEDLTPFTYSASDALEPALNVGWLGEGHAFPVATPQPELVSALRALVADPVNLYRGKHQCEFCPSPPPEERNGLRVNTAPEEILGNGEIRVAGENGITYVAPVLIRHYVEAHHYAPPPRFVHACLARAERLMPGTSFEWTREDEVASSDRGRLGKVGDGTKRRLFAAALDNLLAMAITVLPVSKLAVVNANARWPLACLLYLGYFAIQEGSFQATVGKAVFGLRVERTDGTRLRWRDVILRTLLRVLEVNPLFFGGLPAGITIMATHTRQRLGDLLAHTVVVRKQPAADQ